MVFYTVEEIAEDIIKTQNRALLLETLNPVSESIDTTGALIEFSRWIRNRYDLWSGMPLTIDWITYPEHRNIINGIDYSWNHPDNISAEIVQRVKELIMAP